MSSEHWSEGRWPSLSLCPGAVVIQWVCVWCTVGKHDFSFVLFSLTHLLQGKTEKGTVAIEKGAVRHKHTYTHTHSYKNSHWFCNWIDWERARAPVWVQSWQSISKFDEASPWRILWSSCLSSASISARIVCTAAIWKGRNVQFCFL